MRYGEVGLRTVEINFDVYLQTLTYYEFSLFDKFLVFEQKAGSKKIIDFEGDL